MFAFNLPESYAPQVTLLEEDAFSPNGAVLTALVNQTLALQPDCGKEQMASEAAPAEESVLAASGILTFRVPVSAPDTTAITGYVVDMRGFISKTPGARACVVLALGGTTVVREFRYDEELPPDSGSVHPTAPIAIAHETPATPADRPALQENWSQCAFLESAFSLEPRPNREENPAGFHPQPPFVVHLLIMVQRRTAQEGVMLTIDSLDISAVSR